MKKIIFFSVLFLIIGITVTSVMSANKSPKDVVADLHKAIDKAEAEGVYNCCIEPACTMCYLGHWKFDVGTCFCDEAITEGRDADVCPECKKGLEEGVCESIGKKE